MNRINQLFQNQQKGILSVYFCAGYPTLDNTEEIICTLATNNVQLVEIGIPFSDPMADGPVIQKAATRALNNGMNLKLLFCQLKDIRKKVSIPLILMGYLNPIYHFGFENFCIECSACGIDGMIIPDLPFNDYEKYYKPIVEKYNLHLIMLITPETSIERIKQIDEHTSGFIYMVSSASTTGAQHDFDVKKKAYFKKINELDLKNPRLIGFGISNKQTFEAACQNANGGIIGSRFITLLEENKGDATKAVKILKQTIGLE